MLLCKLNRCPYMMHHAKNNLNTNVFYTHFPSKGKMIWTLFSRLLVGLLISVFSKDFELYIVH